MAAIQKKGDCWHCQFLHRGRRHTFSLGRVPEAEARAVAARVDYLLMRIKQGLMEVPPGDDIAAFVRRDGKPPKVEAAPVPTIPFRRFRDAYLAAFAGGAIEANSHDTATIHLAHLEATLGAGFPLSALTAADLQRHVERRRADVAGATIRKEIDTFRSAWNWAMRMGMTTGEFPGKGLAYPKDREKLPFMTWAAIERRIAAGGEPDELWECLYLTAPETEALLEHVRGRKAPDWVYPMFLFAAHTGARRSEMIRARAEDIDPDGGFATIREKKRVRGRLTTRRVPLSGPLAEAMRGWLPGRSHLFGPGPGPLSVQGAQKAFARVLRGSKWSVLKGWHVLRHGFLSACAVRGIDQRYIDEWAGHCTEQQRRRYRHLAPEVQADKLKSVFG